MKKTISITISGCIFHIEEDGFLALRQYLDSIQKYFAAFADNSEIVSDIESRIAEIFGDLLGPDKQAITLADVERLQATMGTVADMAAAEADADDSGFAGSGAGSSTGSGSGAYNSTTGGQDPKRFYKDKQAKVVSGVLAGIAGYFGIDAIWVRIPFLAFFFGFWFLPAASGVLFLGYMILAFVLPDGTTPVMESQKRLLRNGEDKVVGGVASGLAHYLNVDVSVVRLLFVLSIFLGGTGFVAYLILWIATPEAKTTTDFMRMKGEPITLSGIEASIKDNLKGINSEKTRSNVEKILLFPFVLIAAIIRGLGPILTGITRLVTAFLGVFFIVIGLALAIIPVLFFATGSTGWDFGTPDLPIQMDMHDDYDVRAVLPAISQASVYASGALASMPVLLLLICGVSLVLGRWVLNRYVSLSFVGLFAVVVFAWLAFALPQINKFKDEGKRRYTSIYALPDSATYRVSLNPQGAEDSGDRFRQAKIYLEGYSGDSIVVVQTLTSRGTNRADAQRFADKVTYTTTASAGSLVLDRYYSLGKPEDFRFQELEIKILVPEGKEIALDLPTALVMVANTGDIAFAEKIAERPIMVSPEGVITCATCPDLYETDGATENYNEDNRGNSNNGNANDLDEYGNPKGGYKGGYQGGYQGGYNSADMTDKAKAEAKLRKLKAEAENADEANVETSNIDSISYTIKTKDGRKATMNLKLSDKESLRKIKKVLEGADNAPQQPKAKSEGKEW